MAWYLICIIVKKIKMIQHYLKITWRNALRYRLQSIVSIIGIAIGFMAFILAGYWHYWEYSFDNFHPDADRIYAITTSGKEKAADGSDAEQNQLTESDATYFTTSLPEVEQSCYMVQSGAQATINGATRYFHYILADSSFFKFFHNKIIAGDYRNIPPDSKSVLLTERMARQFSSTNDIVGKEINLGNEENPSIMKVAGIIKNYPGNTDLLFDLIILGDDIKIKKRRPTTFVKLRKGTDINALKQKISSHKSTHVDPYGIDEPTRWTFNLRSLADTHIYCHKELRNRFRNINILAIAGLLVFISALMNHLVLFIGQHQKKQKQRIAYTGIGASRCNMLFKGIVELLAPVIVAFICSLCLIEILFPFYEQYTSITQTNNVSIGKVTHVISKTDLLIRSLYFMGYSIGIFTLISLLVIRLLVHNGSTQITTIEKSNKPTRIFRRTLIMGQIIIGSLFFLSSLTLYKQLHFMEYSDKGIEVDRVLQIEISRLKAQGLFAETIKEELQKNSFIENITLTLSPVLSESGDFYGTDGIIRMPDRDFDKVKADGGDKIMYVESNFVSFFRIPIVEGSDMNQEINNRILVNETGARTLGVTPVINHPTLFDKTISGIIRDYKYCPLQYPIQKVLFTQRSKGEELICSYRHIYVKYAPGKQKEVMGYIREVMQKHNATEEVTYTELSEVINRFNKPEKMIFTLFSMLSFLCILISSFGIYCLVALTAEQRKKEIAIRKVNGATIRNILNLFCKEYLLLVVAGNMLALPIGYYFMKQWLETYAYHTGLSWWLFAVVFIITCVLVLLSVAEQVNKNTKGNPCEALKSE